MSILDRMADAVADRRNVTGLLGAAGGLGLTYGHIIASGWWAITAGLYGAGFLAAHVAIPRRAGQAASPPASAAELSEALRRLSERVGPDLPEMARRHLEDILSTSSSIQEHLRAMDESKLDTMPIRQVLGDYVPETLRAYERVPKSMRQRRVDSSGQSPDQQITEQLAILAEQMDSLAIKTAKGDLAAVEAQGRFLRERFNTVDPFIA